MAIGRGEQAENDEHKNTPIVGGFRAQYPFSPVNMKLMLYCEIRWRTCTCLGGQKESARESVPIER